LSPITNDPPPGRTRGQRVALGDRLRATGIRDGGCDYELTGRAVGVRPDNVYGPEAVPGLTVPDELELSPQLIVA
jgi:hypothetical protein